MVTICFWIFELRNDSHDSAHFKLMISDQSESVFIYGLFVYQFCPMSAQFPPNVHQISVKCLFNVHSMSAYCTLWCFCSYADIGNSYLGNSTYMKVILTKNLNFIIIIYHTKFQFAKISRTMKKCNFLNFYDFYVLKMENKKHFFS